MRLHHAVVVLTGGSSGIGRAAGGFRRLAAVAHTAREILEVTDRVDVLINNAGLPGSAAALADRGRARGHVAGEPARRRAPLETGGSYDEHRLATPHRQALERSVQDGLAEHVRTATLRRAAAG